MSAVERRINLRLLSYWEKLRRGRTMPGPEELNPDDLRDLWDCCFTIHAPEVYKADFNYSYLGQFIIDAYHEGHIKGDSGPMISPIAANTSAHFRKVMETGKPLTEEGQFTNRNGKIVKYRQCLMPLGREDKIAVIFGGLSFKIFSDA